MKFSLTHYYRHIPEEELLEDLRQVASQNRGTLPRSFYQINGKFSAGAYEKRFGSWNKALAAAGIGESSNSHPKLTEDMLFENLEEVWLTLGRQPRRSEVVRPLSKYTYGTYEKRYGTWMKALEKFVEAANSEPIETDDESPVDAIQLPPIDNKPNPPKTKEHVAFKSSEVRFKDSHKTKRDINWRMRWQVLDRDNFRCVSCGLSPAIAPGTILHVDHIKPWSKGGETVLENLQTLCATCNLGKGNVE